MPDLVMILAALAVGLTLVAVGAVVVHILRDPVVGAGLIVFFLPFERIPSLELAGVSLRLNHLIGGLTLLVWFSLVLVRRRTLTPLPFLPLLLGFVVALFASLPGAVQVGRGVTVVIFSLFAMSLGLIITQLVTSRDSLRRIIWLLGLSALIVTGFGFYQFLGDLAGLPNWLTGLMPGYSKAVLGLPRIQGPSLEPLFFGNYLLVPLALALAGLLVPQQWFSQRLLATLACLFGLALILTVSRGALIGFGALLATLLFFRLRAVVTPRNLLIAGLVGIVIVGVVGAILVLVRPDAAGQFVAQLTIRDFGVSDSTAGRLNTWFAAIELWQMSPVLGIGAGNFGPAILGYPDAAPATGWQTVNNQYLELLAETGLVGLGLFLLFLAALLLRSLRAFAATRDDPDLRFVIVGLTAAIVGIVVQYNFFSTLYIVPVWVAFGLLMAAQSITLSNIKMSHDA